MTNSAIRNHGLAALLAMVCALTSSISRAELSPSATWAFDLLTRVEQWQSAGPLDFLPSRSNNNANALKQIQANSMRTPIYFEPNVGQVATDVKFLARGVGYTLFLTADEAVLALRPSQFAAESTAATVPGAVIRTRLEGADRNAKPQVEGLERLRGISNYLIGNDPKKWHTNIPHYQRVRYAEVYPGIDLVYYGNPHQLEHDFIVAPGVDPSVIQLAISGAERVRVSASGDLILTVPGGEVVQQAPKIYQIIEGQQQAVAGRYVLQNVNLAENGQPVSVAVVDPVIEALRVGFEVAQYDARQPLVIDPVTNYSTYLGGIKDDYGTSIAVDLSGKAYVTGATMSIDFPVKPLASVVDPTIMGVKTYDAFVAKFDFSLSGSASLIYATYLGGSDDKDDIGYGIAVDRLGVAYVTGMTASQVFPLLASNGLSGVAPVLSTGVVIDGLTLLGGKDAFITVLNGTGGGPVYSTYLGGTKDEEGRGIALDSSGKIYITGFTNSTDFPLQIDPLINAFQPALLGGTDVFVTRIDDFAKGTLGYSTYLGGAKDDKGAAISVDSIGNVYVTGSTASTNFPVTSWGFDTVLGGSLDGFMTKFEPANMGMYSVLYSTYLGGAAADSGAGISIDSSFNVYVTGSTTSSDFPITSNVAQSNYGGSGDAFITKLDPLVPGASSLIFSTYLGGNKADSGAGIVVTEPTPGDIRIYVTGATASANLPAISNTLGGAGDAFVARISASFEDWIYVMYLGGDNGIDSGAGITADQSGSLYVTGAASSTTFPTTNNAFDRINGSSKDAFIVKLDDTFYGITIIVKEKGMGTVTSNPAGIDCGTACTKNYAAETSVTLTASPEAGYVFDGWSGSSVCSGKGACIVDIKASQTITANFVLKTYPVTARAGANGKITPTTQTVTHGLTTTFTVSPDSGYSATVDGCNGTLTGNTYTTGSITSACTVNAAFTLAAAQTYTVTATAGANGTISPSTMTVNHGSTATFTVTPSTDYFASVSGTCGGTLSGNTYTTNAITANCSVTANFSKLIVTKSATTLITHYYTSILGRIPEASGLTFWQNLVAEKQAQGLDAKPVFRDMANDFFNSIEYLGNHTSDTQFITDLYRTFFQRDPDAGGISFWLKQLASGIDRNQAMSGFLHSPEFTTFMENLGF